MGTLAWHPPFKKSTKETKMIPEIPWETREKPFQKKSCADWVSHPFIHEDTSNVSRIYNIIRDRAEVHAGPCKSLTAPWWMTLVVIKSPTNPCSVWQSCLGANEGFQEPSHATRWCFCTDTSELVCVWSVQKVISLSHTSFLFTLPAKYLWPAICQP